MATEMNTAGGRQRQKNTDENAQLHGELKEIIGNMEYDLLKVRAFGRAAMVMFAGGAEMDGLDQRDCESGSVVAETMLECFERAMDPWRRAMSLLDGRAQGGD